MRRMPRTILVIGNSDGIGAAATAALRARGDRVVGISRRPAGAIDGTHVVQDVTGAGYVPVLRRLAEAHDGFDACIYCAGVGSGLTLPDLSSEARVFDINVVAMVRTLDVLLPRWVERRQGHFIGLSSLADDFYNSDAPSYSASKAAMSNYLVSLGLAVRQFNVAMTSLRFGFVDTKMAKAPVRPMMMTREAAARTILRCLETRPLQMSTPKLMGLAVHALRLAQSLRVWTS
jgi:NAD(P)-dependent dehydrogenase (short-subunit alcohol dehydrogenase family)